MTRRGGEKREGECPQPVSGAPTPSQPRPAGGAWVEGGTPHPDPGARTSSHGSAESLTPRGRGSLPGSSRWSFKGPWEDTPYAKGLFAGLEGKAKGKHTGVPGRCEVFWAQVWPIYPTWGPEQGIGRGPWGPDLAMGPSPALWSQGMAAQDYPTTMPALPTLETMDSPAPEVAEDSWYELVEHRFSDYVIIEEIEAKIKEVDTVQSSNNCFL